MRNLIVTAACLVLSCSRPLAPSADSPRSWLASSAAPCQPAASFGAVPDDGSDDRTAFQAALDSGCLDLRGAPGRYHVDTPATRGIGVLIPPAGARILGDGAEEIEFRGDPGGVDWAGIRVTVDDVRITGVNFRLTDASGRWDEQSHVIELYGPLQRFELSRGTITYPVQDGVSRGDCVRIRGYPTRRVWDVSIHHVVFDGCARSGVAVYGGLHGRWQDPDQRGDSRCSTRIHHNLFRGVPDQDLDCEGVGDVGGLALGDGTVSCVEWDRNIHRASPMTSLAVSLYPGVVDFHHNTLERGLDILGGSHRVHHNHITQLVQTSSPVVQVRKTGSPRFRDEVWVRPVEAGPGPVFQAAQKITAPTDVRLDDVTMIQHTPYGSVSAHGIVGLILRDVTIVDHAAPGMVRDAVRVEGTNGLSGIRSTGVVVLDASVSGPHRAAVSVSGSYTGGFGTLELRDSRSERAGSSIRCENVAPKSRSDGTSTGGVTGPLVASDNTMPATIGCTVTQEVP